jgi:lipopolysaccharide/colanic/teichoic acid biosynthesis glycosyltransferase
LALFLQNSREAFSQTVRCFAKKAAIGKRGLDMQAQAQHHDISPGVASASRSTKSRYDRRTDSRPEREEQAVRRFTPGRIPVVRRQPHVEKFTRTMDVTGALLGLILAFPVLLLSMVLIKLTSRGPIFFCQIRVGEGGRLFRMYKLRTMIFDAEKQRSALMHRNEMSGPVFKIRRDPRITRLGRYLRKYSIDEVPQFWNVLKGDMSLVGPRPPLPREVKKYKRWQLQRLMVKPGITCLWQVSGRNRIGFEDWVRLDIRYIRTRSFLVDLKIILQTFKVVFIRPDGA